MWALKALIYFEIVTTLALAIGLVVGNVLQPGAGMNIDATAIDTKGIESYVAKSKDQSTIGFVLDIIPNTFFSAFAEGNILQVLLIALLFAFALQSLGERGKPLLDFIEHVAQVLFKMVGFIMRLAPIGAFGAMAFTIGKYGIEKLSSLALLMLAFYLTCLIFLFGVLGIIARLSGFSILRFIAYIKDELLIVLGTSSSESVLPRMIAKMKKLGCEESVVGLVDPCRLFVQSRRHVHLSDDGNAFPGASDKHRSLNLAAARRVGRPAPDVQGRGGRHRVRLHHACGDALFDRDHTGRIDRAHPRHRPLHVGSPRADEPRRQRRRDNRYLEVRATRSMRWLSRTSSAAGRPPCLSRRRDQDRTADRLCRA